MNSVKRNFRALHIFNKEHDARIPIQSFLYLFEIYIQNHYFILAKLNFDIMMIFVIQYDGSGRYQMPVNETFDTTS